MMAGLRRRRAADTPVDKAPSPVGRGDMAGADSSVADGPLVDPRLLAQLEVLQLGTRKRLIGALTGDHRSKRHGSSLDFADQREYHPGDDFRRIDYHVMARLDQILVRLYEADDDLVVRLAVDTSASMAFGDKLKQAARVAAVLGFVAINRRDVVTLHTFPGGARHTTVAPRFRGRASTGHLFAQLQALRPAGVTGFSTAVSDLLSRPGPPGLTIVVSDFLTGDWSDGIKRLPSRGADLAIVHVLADDDLDPSTRDDLRGDLDLVDAETSDEVAVSASADVIEQYTRGAQAWVDDVAGRCRRAGAAYIKVGANDDVGTAVLGEWRKRGVLR